MPYRYSDTYLRNELRLGGATFEFVGLGLIMSVAAGTMFWRFWGEDPSSRPWWLGFLAGVIAVGGLLGTVVVWVRRLFTPPERLMKAAIFEIDAHGLWRETPKSRDLLIGGRELVAIEVHRTSTLADPQSIQLCGRSRSIEVHDLDAMWHFLEELNATFPRVPLKEVQPSWGRPKEVQDSDAG